MSKYLIIVALAVYAIWGGMTIVKAGHMISDIHTVYDWDHAEEMGVR